MKVFLNDRPLGTITVRGGFSDYRLDLPPEVAAEAAARQTPAVVRFVSTTWVPKAFLGGSDDGPLGIMLDRIRDRVDACCRSPIPVSARPSRRPTRCFAWPAWRARAARDRPRREVRRILVLRLERIGDLLMSLPALHAIRRRAPQAAIDLVVGSWNEALARQVAGIDGIETMDAPWLARGAGGAGWPALLRQARSWRARRYDLAINLEGDIRSIVLMSRSGARWCAGFGMAGGGPLLDDDVGVRSRIAYGRERRPAGRGGVRRWSGPHGVARRGPRGGREAPARGPRDSGVGPCAGRPGCWAR